jgi:hypothetical protein
MHDATMGDIRKNRNMMLSAIFKVLAHKVLPKLERRRFWSQELQSRHAGHNKERNNEHLCTICVILEVVLEYIPIDAGKSPESQAAAIVDKWIQYHEDQAKQAEITSNTLLNLMDGLAQEIVVKIRGRQDLPYQEHPEFELRTVTGWPAGKKIEVKVFDDPEYLTAFYLTRPYDAPRDAEDDDWFDLAKSQRLEFILTSAQLHTLFNRYCGNQHTKNSYENPTSLGSRIANDKKVMEKGGWEYVQGDNPDKLTYKRKGGYDYWRFSKVINAIE